MNNVCIMGMGYIGLPTGTLLANLGYKVHGVDISENVIEKLNQGQIHITEPDLEGAFLNALRKKTLHCSTEPKQSDIFLICVPTPFNEDKSPKLDFIKQAGQAIAPFITGDELIILESTSPVGATEKLRDWILEARPELKDKKIHFAYCPERVLPGKILHELVHNDRIVGGLTDEATKTAKDFYSSFVQGQVFTTHSRTAELCKLVENSFRDTNIAFANELSMISDQLDINVWEVIHLANRHPRVNILKPGPGVGGHCIAVDPWFIASSVPDLSPLIQTARKVNDFKPEYVQKRASSEFKKEIPICLMGLAFKENIDDLRESPSKEIALGLQNLGFKLEIFEPNISELPDDFSSESRLIPIADYKEHIQKAQQILILVKHRQFKNIPFDWLEAKFIDCCGLTTEYNT